MRELAGRDVRLTLELRGKAANVVFDDAALDQAVEGIVNGIYFNQGHVCAGSRLLVQESIYEPLLEKLKRACPRLRRRSRWTRTPTSERSTRGPGSRRSGRASSRAGGGRRDLPAQMPSPRAQVLVRRRRSSRTSRRATGSRGEVFGPVLSMLTFRTPEAVERRTTHAGWAVRRGVDREGVEDPVDSPAPACGRRWPTNTYSRFDPASPFGGYRELTWARGSRHGLAPT